MVVAMMTPHSHGPIQHSGETTSNALRSSLTHVEPRSLRTFTPTQAVLAQSAGAFHWTPEGKRLFDFTSGVLVANLGHNPISWMRRFRDYMGWPANDPKPANGRALRGVPMGYIPALTMTAYNGVTPIEIEASQRLLDCVMQQPGGGRLNQVMWAASGSEAIQKALWATMAFDKTRPMILASRYGFHGKKGLSNAITGSETDAERDPRVRFFRFPMHECIDVSHRDDAIDLHGFRAELDALWHQFGARIGTMITEPYLGGGGSYHPQPAYLQMLVEFCREKGILFILDEVQANFGRTGKLFAYSSYGIEPDMVVLGKGLGNGVPVAAVVGRRDIFNALEYGEGSDTWSANPLCCAAVLATLDEFDHPAVMMNANQVSAIIEAGLVQLKELPFVAHVRGEKGGMVWGIDFCEHDGKSAAEWANAAVLAAYHGDGDDRDGIHLLGPLSKKVVRISPPLTITVPEARDAMALLHRALHSMVESRIPALV